MVKIVWRKTLSGELKKALENAERIKKTGIKPLKVFVGWDSREDIAYQVCKQSILNHASVPVQVIPLKQQELRKRGIYWRDEEQFRWMPASLVPAPFWLREVHLLRFQFQLSEFLYSGQEIDS